MYAPPLRGRLRDTVLDWEDPLPEADLEKAEQHSKLAGMGARVTVTCLLSVCCVEKKHIWS